MVPLTLWLIIELDNKVSGGNGKFVRCTILRLFCSFCFF